MNEENLKQQIAEMIIDASGDIGAERQDRNESPKLYDSCKSLSHEIKAIAEDYAGELLELIQGETK